MKRYRFFLFLGSSLLIMLLACVEEIGFENENFEDVLVVEATITNENKQQVVLLSRTYTFEEDGPVYETGATVIVKSDLQDYIFEEVESGKYVSATPFAALPNINYRLQITTSSGQAYGSGIAQLTTSTEIDELYVERETNDDGVNGMSFYVDSFDPSGESKYYRYEYEEAFKIIAPMFVYEDLYVIADDYPDCRVGLRPRDEIKRICYKRVASEGINVTSTVGFEEDRVSRYLTHFVSSEDYSISHRYSLLVKQFIQSADAHNYFETIANFSGAGSIFAQSQPGFIDGNVFSESNSFEKVIGFFQVSSVTTKRIFFNYEDYYPNENLPPYRIGCQPLAPEIFGEPHTYICGPLLTLVRLNIMVYYDINTGQADGGPYLVVPRECGDCTAIGSTIPPDFWIE